MPHPQILSVAVFSNTGIRLLELLISKDININCVFASEDDSSQNISKIRSLCVLNFINLVILEKNEHFLSSKVSSQSSDIYFLLLLWWPHILKLNSIDKYDFIINLHPSLLPYGKGKYGYFWSIINNEPFGASLHLVDEGIDTGKVLAQREIVADLTDTGEKLYNKGVELCITLFDEEIENVLDSLRKKTMPQRNNNMFSGSSKSKNDFEKYCIEVENRQFFIKDAIRYLRARTFENGSSYRFTLNNETYECNLIIKKVN